jgi:hypothetical protein
VPSRVAGLTGVVLDAVIVAVQAAGLDWIFTTSLQFSDNCSLPVGFI